MVTIDRRALMVSAAGLFLGGAARAQASAVPDGRRMAFELHRDGNRIGTHTLTFSRRGDDLVVDVAIDIEVKVAFITVFRYEHRNQEIWRDGRLLSLDARTNHDGDHYRVVAKATGDGLQVDGSGGRFTAPADTISTSWWNDAYVRRDQLLDSEKGKMMQASTKVVGRGPVEIAGGRSLDATHYRTSGEVKVQTWFAQEQWVGMSFIAFDQEVVYRRVDGNLPRPA